MPEPSGLIRTAATAALILMAAFGPPLLSMLLDRRDEARRRAEEVAKALVPSDHPFGVTGEGRTFSAHGAGGAFVGRTALATKTFAPFPARLWRLLANPVRYLLTGRMEW